MKKDIYYENFSKYLLTSNKNVELETYNYSKWIVNKKKIENIPLKVVKHTLKNQSLSTTGNKKTLIMRLNNHYMQIYSAIQIQKIFRGFLVRELEKSRGPALKNRLLCINDTEFVTMNNIDKIQNKDFFSYCDENGFVYGFSVYSLIELFGINRKLINPYNRSEIPFDVLQSLFSVYKKSIFVNC